MVVRNGENGPDGKRKDPAELSKDCEYIAKAGWTSTRIS